MWRRLATTVVVVLGLLTSAYAGQVQHPINGPSSSTPAFYPCWGNASGNQADNCPNGARGITTPQPGTAYLLTKADCGTAVHFTSNSSVVVTLPNTFLVGCSIDVFQDGLGQVTFVPASGATLRNAHGFTKTFGQYAAVGLHVGANSGGNTAVWYLLGDGA